MKYNKLIIGGCSFVASVHDAEDIRRNIHPEYVKNLIKKYPNKNSSEIREIQEIINQEDVKKYTWPFLLKNYLDIPLVHFANGGKSNPRIFHDIINYLIENDNETNNLVIIGTTSVNRIYRWLEDKKDYVDLHLKDFDDKPELMWNSNAFSTPEELIIYQKLYLKYFHDDDESLRQIQKNIDLLKYICKHQNNKLIIFDNLTYALSDKLYRQKNNFIKKNKDNLLFFKDDIFCFPEFVLSYDTKYRLTHLNRVDHKIFFDIIKDKV